MIFFAVVEFCGRLVFTLFGGVYLFDSSINPMIDFESSFFVDDKVVVVLLIGTAFQLKKMANLNRLPTTILQGGAISL